MCNNNNGSSLAEILEKILFLQQIDNNTPTGCNRPFLGEVNGINANTRPINLYSCCTGNLWTMPYNNDGTEEESSVFRIESINEDCATFRVLSPTDNGYSATDSYFTINLNCICCIKCLEDTYVTNI